MFWSFPGPSVDVKGFSGAGDLSTEAEVRHGRRQKHVVITRRFVPLSGQHPGSVDCGSHERSRELFKQAFAMVMVSSYDGTLSLVPCEFFIPLNCLDYFLFDSAIAPNNAIGYQLVTLRRSIPAEEKAQILDPLTGSRELTTYFIAFVAFISSLYCSYSQKLMLFFNICNRVLHVLVHMLLPRVTSA